MGKEMKMVLEMAPCSSGSSLTSPELSNLAGMLLRLMKTSSKLLSSKKCSKVLQRGLYSGREAFKDCFYPKYELSTLKNPLEDVVLMKDNLPSPHSSLKNEPRIVFSLNTLFLFQKPP